MPVLGGEAGRLADGWTGAVPMTSISVTSSPPARSASQMPQRRWSDGATSRHSPLSDACITAAAAELAAVRAAGLQARELWQTPSPASAASAASARSPQPQAKVAPPMTQLHVADGLTPLPRPALSVGARGEQSDAAALAGMPGRERASSQCTEPEQLPAPPPSFHAWDDSNILRSAEEQQQPGTLPSPTLPTADTASHPRGVPHAAMAAVLPADRMAKHLPLYAPRDRPMLGCSDAAHHDSRPSDGILFPDLTSALIWGPPMVSICAQQLQPRGGSVDRTASHSVNGWHPRLSVTAGLGVAVRPDAVPLRVRFGGSRSGTPTPYPSDDGGPSTDAHSTTAGGSHADGGSISHAAVLAPSAADMDHVQVSDAVNQHLNAAAAAARDIPSAHDDSVTARIGVDPSTAAELLPDASDSLAPEWATHEHAAKTPLQQFDVQQPGRPTICWAQDAAPTVRTPAAEAQEPQYVSPALAQTVQKPASCHDQRDDDGGPAAVIDLAIPLSDGVQLPAINAESYAQPALRASRELQPRSSLLKHEAEVSVPQQCYPAGIAYQADPSTAAALIPGDAAATPQRGLLARLPFARLLRARRWRCRSDGHTVDETILGARPPSHDGGALPAGFCTPPRTPRRCVLIFSADT